ncbi:MAG TPA: hypothetical protein VFX60_18610 [Micromonospora sp.]|nr:hypothetical protein [Micromonospora sp.]
MAGGINAVVAWANSEVPPDETALAATALTARRAVQVATAFSRGLVRS